MQQTIRADAGVYQGARHHEQLQPAATFVPPPHPWGALVTSCIALFLIAVNTTAINTAVSAIADDLTLSSTTLAWALNAYLLAVAAFVVLGGQLGDVLGRKRVFVIGMVLYTLAAIVVATSGTAFQLIGGRALQGMGAAVLMPATIAILHDAFPKEKQGQVLGIWGAVGGVAFAVGPLIGGIFTDAINWRWVWWSNVPVAIVALVLARTMLRGLAPGKKGVRVDVGGIVLLAVGLFTAVLALQQGARWGWGAPSILGLFAFAAVTLTAFVLVELRVKQPLVHLRLLTNRVFTGGNVGTFINAVVLIGLLYFFNLYAQSSVLLDYSALLAGIALLPFGMGIFAASLVSGRLADRIGARLPVAVGIALQAVGCFLLYFTDVTTTYSGLWLPTLIAGIGVGMTFSTPSAAGLEAVPPEECGEASGIINIFRYVGASLVIAVGSLFYTGVGIAEMNRQLDAAGVSRVEEEQLDQALTGSPSAISEQANQLQGQQRQAFISGAQQGTVDGFDASMLLMAVSSVGGLVLWLVLMRPSSRGGGGFADRRSRSPSLRGRQG
ncbi:MAG TPA: MFS transporter [Acidimicrobiia bacterium]|nr:MFS transporter [Acidimicrobiia bacterium]